MAKAPHWPNARLAQLAEKVSPLIRLPITFEYQCQKVDTAQLPSEQFLTPIQLQFARNLLVVDLARAFRCPPHSAENQRPSVTSRVHRPSSAYDNQAFGSIRAPVRTQTEDT